jgi:hypothetical protein
MSAEPRAPGRGWRSFVITRRLHAAASGPLPAAMMACGSVQAAEDSHEHPPSVTVERLVDGQRVLVEVHADDLAILHHQVHG